MAGRSTRPEAGLFAGSCHCGAISVLFETSLDPGALAVRACACGFCRRHGARTATDPDGWLRIALAHAGAARRYRFGLGTADYLVCARCGAYAAAVIGAGGGIRATLNINLLDRRAEFDPAPPAADYSGESAQARIARRQRLWTPAQVVIAGAGS
jgi:hypothetical protein